MGCAPSNELLLLESDTKVTSHSRVSVAMESENNCHNEPEQAERLAEGQANKLAGEHEVTDGASDKEPLLGEKPGTTWRKTDVPKLIEQNPGVPWWKLAKSMLPAKKTVVEPHLNRRGWKTVRLFVSSTFKDMHSEREYLVKRIFPQLRQWCVERLLRLVECDLRWGVPKDASTRETLNACLSEIDRCYEENEHPYFLALISERYGWVPTDDQVPADIQHRYKWLPGMSVTTLEVMTGAYWHRNPNALYMLRDPDYLKDLPTSMASQVYMEPGDEHKESLEILKGQLLDLDGADETQRVSPYKCEVAGVNEKRAELTGFDEFGERVMSHFKQALDHQYPATSLGEELSEEEIQAQQHEGFMTQRSAVLLGRDKVISDVYKHIKGTSSALSVPLILLGFPGSGKSAVVATLARGLSTQSDIKVLYHFVGATPSSTDLSLLLTRFWKTLMPAEDNAPVDDGELRRCLSGVLHNASQRLPKGHKLVILIDALNQLDDDAEEKLLDWLPRTFPSNVRMVVSTLEGPCLDALKKDSANLPEVMVSPLGNEIRSKIAINYLSEYNKILGDDQLQILVTKEDAGRPLYLTIACEELRVFGEFRKLTKKIEDLPQDLTCLLAQVLERIVAENGGELVSSTLCFIECSRHGLLENELLDLLVSFSKLCEEGADRLPMAEWAIVYLGLRPFLRPAGGSGEGRLDFYHRTISKSVRTKYLTDANKKMWHEQLADYFQTSTDLTRRAEELPHQLLKAGNIDALQKALAEYCTFIQLYTPALKQSLMRYWLLAGGYETAAKCTKEALEQHALTLGMEETLKLQTKMLNFFTDIGQYAEAENLLESVLQRTTEQFGAISQQMCEPLYAAVILYYLQGIKVVYSSDPVYARCSKLGRGYAEKCAKVYKEHFAANDLHLGRVLTKCGYFNGNYLEDAKVICKGRSEQDYAEILYNLGEKNQYKDMDKAISLFEESLKLCLSHFGHYHLSTARCYQLYGQLYWNRDASMVICLEKYKNELDILETLLGAHHPTTVRSREDVIIILQTLKRNGEATELQKEQP